MITWLVLFAGTILLLFSLLPKKSEKTQVSIRLGDKPPVTRQWEREGYFLGFWGWVGLAMVVAAGYTLLLT